ncbi:MAG: HdeD family acid-resistance protein [Halobacteriota archaeon]
MAEQKTSMWLRIVEIIAGIIVLALGGYAIAYPGVTAATLIAFLAVGLLVIAGIEFVRVFSEGISGWQRLANAGFALIAFLLALGILVAPLFWGGLTLGWLVALTLIFVGLAVAARGTPGMLIVGIIAVILGIVALVWPAIGVATIVLLVAIGLIIFGLELIVSGLLGRWV